jgi:hypothetical protein
LVVFSILPIDQKDSSSPTPERRDISESAPIIPTVSTLTDYQHARNVIKKSFSQLLPVIIGQNVANAINASVGRLIQMIHYKQAAPSQRTSLWDQMK